MSETLSYPEGTLTLVADGQRVYAYTTDRTAAKDVATVIERKHGGVLFHVAYGHELQRLIDPIGGTAEDILPLQNKVRNMIVLQPHW